MYLVDCQERCFLKEGKEVYYYKAVFSDIGKEYQIKRITKSLFDKLIKDLPIYVGADIHRMLYDEYGRVCEIEI